MGGYVGGAEMTFNVTPAQEKVLIYIKQFSDENDYPPTVREICKGLKLNSPATVFTHLENLKEKGLITFRKHKARTIKVLKEE
jgi:repressor LexA